MLSDERRLEIEQTARRFGSANCWTGTSGMLAGMLIELLKEVERLRAELTARSVTAECEPPEPDTCHECGEIAVGYDYDTPLCAAHYRSRPTVLDKK